jgi:hypothetical protein
MVKSRTQKKKNTTMKPRLRPGNNIAKRRPTQERRDRGQLIRMMLNTNERRCVRHYAAAQLDPFSAPAGACVPIPPCLPSAKRKIFARGYGLVQSNGFGGLVANTSMVNDIDCVRATNGLGTGASIGGSNPELIPRTNNSELTATAFNDGDAQVRIVAVGVRLRYAGKQIDMNGTVAALEEPMHQDLWNKSFEDLLEFDKVKTVPFNRDWVVAAWQPVLPSETSYSTNAYASPYDQPTNPLAILIRAQTSTETLLPFEWEWFAHYEAVGVLARGKSESHVAPILGPKAIATLQSAPSRVFDHVSNDRISRDAIADKVALSDYQDQHITWSEIGSRVAKMAVGAITSRAAAQYMTGGLAAIAA